MSLFGRVLNFEAEVSAKPEDDHDNFCAFGWQGGTPAELCGAVVSPQACDFPATEGNAETPSHEGGKQGQAPKKRKPKKPKVKLEFPLKLAPMYLESQLLRVLRPNGSRGRNHISTTDARVFGLPPLGVCPMKMNNKTCHCMELVSFPHFQKDIRAFYCRVVQESSRDVGNQYLLSLIVPASSTQSAFVQGESSREFVSPLRFKIPVFLDCGTARMFFVCAQQFQKLFGLSSKRAHNLMHRKRELLKKMEEGPQHQLFRWSEDGMTYFINGYLANGQIYPIQYPAFRSDYWVDFLVEHGGHSPDDDFEGRF